eukprot:a678841_165.p1 GENE.a678841_165~~a678841_165.p1  ORF type:complete len:497 (+),score=152.31 a678841_165:45-1493(+)
MAAFREPAPAPALTGTVVAQFQTREGEVTGPQLDIPVDITAEQLQILINELLHNDEPMPYSFFLSEDEIATSVAATLTEQGLSTESAIVIVYQPQALFRVRAVTRCTGTMPGHTEAVLSTHFSPDSLRAASGSGDTTVRLWDVETATPIQTLEGHRNWVLCVSWSPDGTRLASACKAGEIRVWDGATGAPLGKPIKGHTKAVVALAWKPLHRDPEARYLASASKDCTVRVLDTYTGRTVFTISGHTRSVTCLRWSGAGLIFTGSQDRSVRAWSEDDGRLVRSYDGHGHWVNSLALSSDFVLRTGAHDHVPLSGTESVDERVAKARARYEAVSCADGSRERMITASDDHTLILWAPYESKKPVARLTGHQQPVSSVVFSPDGNLVASASFDKSVKLWAGLTGKFIATMRGHVGPVYMLAWSADSRLVASASKDSTIRVWAASSHKLQALLAGHADEVFAIDWSPDGYRLVSGSKDRLLKIWRQ